MNKNQNTNQNQFPWKVVETEKRLKKPFSSCSLHELNDLFAKKEEQEIGYTSF